VEEQPAESIFLQPKSEYTARLAAATPRLADAPTRELQSQEQQR
jgi:ABC-type dipeptide/oligopeptide/nickel transport system ATPase component